MRRIIAIVFLLATLGTACTSEVRIKEVGPNECVREKTDKAFFFIPVGRQQHIVNCETHGVEEGVVG